MEKAVSQNPEVHIFLAVCQEYQLSSKDLHSAYPYLTTFPKEFHKVPTPESMKILMSRKNVLGAAKVKNIPAVQAASGLLRMLNDKHFLFWRSFFHRIMPHVDVLYDQLQSRYANSTIVQR
jgi:hypothetical protein